MTFLCSLVGSMIGVCLGMWFADQIILAAKAAALQPRLRKDK